MIVEGILLILVIFLHYWLSKSNGLPPGPWTYPFVGSGMVVNMDGVKEYQKRYGDIFRCELGSVKVVYLCDFKLIKEAMGKFEFADRPNFEGLHFMTDGKEAGVMFSSGRRWLNARRFLLRKLKDLGMGKERLAKVIHQEAKYLVEDFKKTTGKPVSFSDSLNVAVVNVVWQVVARSRFDLQDKDVTEFIRIFRSLQDTSWRFILLDFIPLLKLLPPFVKEKFFALGLVDALVVSARKLFGPALEGRSAELEEASSPTENLIDEYFTQMENQADVAQYFHETDLMRVVFDLFGAGFDTTSNMLHWMILYAAKYPEVQKRVQKQIDDVVPEGEYPANHHKAQLPLVEAFIHEVLRCSSLIPFAVMHSVSNDVSLADYHIPKGTVVFGVTGYCHQDPRFWVDPQEFKLDRFLDDEGRFVVHKEGFAPFGIGKRSCLGEPLARMQLVLFTAAIL